MKQNLFFAASAEQIDYWIITDTSRLDLHPSILCQ
jgi:hypothetical protein